MTFFCSKDAATLIRWPMLLVISWLTLALPAHATNVLLLGDSLSASYGMQADKGWAKLAQQRLAKDYPQFTLLNFSASGETTGGGKARLARLLDKNKVDVLWIELGGNDGLRGYPIHTIGNNLSQMIAMAKGRNIEVILTQVKIPPSMGRRYTTLFSDLYPKLAKETKVALMPFFIEPLAGDASLMQKDQIHPNEKAQPIIAEFVVEYFKQYLTR